MRSALIFDVDDAWVEASEFAPKANKKPSKWKEAKRQLKKGSSSAADKTFIIKVDKTWAASTLRKMHYNTRCRAVEHLGVQTEPIKSKEYDHHWLHIKKSFADFAW